MSASWPARLGGYDVVRPLSVGGMGAVLLATKSAHGFEKRVAIKVVLPHLLGDDDAQALFADEAKLAARFAHPNLVPTFDFGLDEGLFFLVMELVEGPSFLDFLRQKNAPSSPLSPPASSPRPPVASPGPTPSVTTTACRCGSSTATSLTTTCT